MAFGRLEKHFNLHNNARSDRIPIDTIPWNTFMVKNILAKLLNQQRNFHFIQQAAHNQNLSETCFPNMVHALLDLILQTLTFGLLYEFK